MAKESFIQKKQRAARIVGQLKILYPDAHCALNHGNPFQLLIATILSAQCTDDRVNRVTPALFARFPDAPSLAQAEMTDIENIIRSIGFFRAKAKAIQTTARQLTEQYAGEVPQTMNALIQLRGVGRKTANVVLGNAFRKNVGVVVDTHVGRLARRMGLSEHLDPEKVERDMMRLIDQPDWTLLSHLLIFHGRRVCAARKPNCAGCVFGPAAAAARRLCPQRGIVIRRQLSKVNVRAR